MDVERLKNKEEEYFRTIGYTHPDSYISYRRVSEFSVKVSIAEEDFREEISQNLLNQSIGTQTVYLNSILEKIEEKKAGGYAPYQPMLDFLGRHELSWKKLDGFYRTLRDFYLLELQGDGRISYFNKEPDIPTDYDTREMAFLNKGIGFMTSEDFEKSQAFNDKYGKYNHDSWDIRSRDIMPEKTFLEMLSKIWGLLPKVPMQFTRSAAGEVEDRLYQLKFYVFNAFQGNSVDSMRSHVKNIIRMLNKDQKNASFDNFQIFVDSLEYNYPIEHSVAYYVHKWRENLKYLKKEILDNLILLDGSARNAYLERLEFECKDLVKYVNTFKSSIDKWLEKYETTEMELFDPNPFIPSELNRILNSEVPKFHDTFEEGFNSDTEGVQHEFYNYHYGETLFDALLFIEEKTVSKEEETSAPDRNKLRSELTVGQLSYFFKLVMEEKMVSFRSKTQVHNFISENFDTARQADISSDSVKNKMDSPNPKDIAVIKEKLLHMLQLLKKESES